MSALRPLMDLLFPPRATERLVRDATAASLAVLVAPTKVLHATEDIAALLPYREPLVQALVIEAKYHGNAHACLLLGHTLADYLAEFAADQDAYAQTDFALLPVPLSEARLRERGYNQVERVVACALTRLGLPNAPHADALMRVRDTASQAHLSREERLANMKGAFLARNVDPALTYVLVDDVITTGATFAEAATALRFAGASRVICVALAH